MSMEKKWNVWRVHLKTYNYVAHSQPRSDLMAPVLVWIWFMNSKSNESHVSRKSEYDENGIMCSHFAQA